MHSTSFQWTLAFSVLALSQSFSIFPPMISVIKAHASLSPALYTSSSLSMFFKPSRPLCLPPSVPCYASNAMFHFTGKAETIEGFNNRIKAARRDVKKKGNKGIYADSCTHTVWARTHLHRRGHRYSHMLISEELVVRCFPHLIRNFSRNLINHHNLKVKGGQWCSTCARW